MSTKITPRVRNHLLNRINSLQELSPLGVVLAIDDEAVVLRTPMYVDGDEHYLVVDAKTTKTQINTAEIASEAGLAAINCSAAAVAVLLMFGGGLAAPLTGGASTALTYVGYAATTATVGSCLNSAVRTYNAAFMPVANKKLDALPAYKTTLQVLDGVSLLGVGASAVAATRAIKVLKNAGVRTKNVIRSQIQRQERARLTKEIIKMKRPNVSNGEIKRLIRAGAEPKRYSRDMLSQGAIRSLKESVAGGLSFLSSAFDGHVKEVTVSIVGLAG